MAKFKVGDKVRVKNIKADGVYYMEDIGIRDSVAGNMLNHSGKVVTIDEITVAGKYRIKEDCGHWNWVDGMFEGLAENPKIVITTDGKTTTARLFNGKELIRKAEAKCSPDDKFDFMVGAKLAMERLEEKKPEKPTIKVGDFVKVKGGDGHGHFIMDGTVCPVTSVFDDGSIHVDGYCTNVKRICNQLLIPKDYETI